MRNIIILIVLININFKSLFHDFAVTFEIIQLYAVKVSFGVIYVVLLFNITHLFMYQMKDKGGVWKACISHIFTPKGLDFYDKYVHFIVMVAIPMISLVLLIWRLVLHKAKRVVVEEEEFDNKFSSRYFQNGLAERAVIIVGILKAGVTVAPGRANRN